MRSSKEMYHEVAQACSSYTPTKNMYAACNSSVNCECQTPSCLTSAHFTAEEYCDLDLYDGIAESIQK